MDNKNKVIIAVSIVFILAIVGVGVWLYFSNKQTPTPSNGNDQNQTDQSNNKTNSNQTNNGGTPVQRSTDDITNYIVKNEKSLVDPSTNLPIFTIDKSDQPLPGWYVLALRHNNDDTTSDATLVLHDVNGQLTIVAGPGTGIFNNQDLPPEVRDSARRELE